MAEQVVTTLTIDARGAEAGSAAYIRAMRAAQAAADRSIETSQRAQAAIAAQTAVMVGGATSLGRTASAWDRLKASIDPAAAATRAIEQATLTADAAVRRLGVSEEAAAGVLAKVRLQYDEVAQAAMRAAEARDQMIARARAEQTALNSQQFYSQLGGVREIPTGGARASAAVFEAAAREADQTAAAVARLRAELDPLGTAQAAMNAELMEYAALAGKGAISTDELAAAQGLAQQRFLATAGAMTVAGGTARLNQQQMANLSFQMNDMAVMLASGQSPFIMLMQQGMQVAQLFKPGTGIGAALKEVGGGIVAFLTNPLNLAVLGFAAAAGGASLFFRAIFSGEDRTKTALETHKKLIEQIRDRYGEAAKAALDYGRDATRALEDKRASQENVEDLKNAYAKELAGIRNQITARTLDLGAGGAGARAFGDLTARAVAFAAELGKDDSALLKFNKELLQMATDPAVPEGLRRQADGLAAMLKRAVELNQELRQAGVALGLLFQPNQFARTDEASAVRQFNNQTAYALLQMQRQHAADLAGIGARSPSELAAAARASAAAQPIDPTESPAVRAQRIEYAGALALAQAQHQLSEAYQERMRSLDASVASSQLDLELVGKSQREVAALRMQHQLLASLREEAARNGIAIDHAEIAAIRQKADEVGRLAEATARAGLLGNLAFARSQFGRSPIEQTVAEQMRAIYGDDFASHMNSFEANQVRINEQLGIMADLGKSVVSGFVQDIKSGVTVLGALSNALNKIADKLISMAVDQLWANAFGGATSGGGGILGTIVSGIGSLLGGGSAIAGPASALTGGIGHAAAGNDNWRGGLTWVGEEGPEILNLPRGSQIIPFPRLMAVAANGGGGQQINVTVPVTMVQGQSNAEIGAMVGRKVTEQLDAFSRKVLPRRVNEIAKDPRKVG